MTRRAMRQRKNIFFTLLALLVIGSVAWLFAPGESRYQGKKLSAWLISLDSSPLQFIELAGQTNQPTAQALLHMGSSAVSYLVSELRVRDSTLKLKLMALLGKQSIIQIKFTPAYVRHGRAIQACYALGATAKS